MGSGGSYRTLKGMQDILQPEISIWQNIEAAAREVFSVYGFQEIRTPVVEATDVFTRSIGESTDIVEKEMYTFTDKGGRSISLRPEGTASVVRCYVEKNLHTLPAPQKFFYTGPMFRYERPQSGRFRQFYQIGVEAFADPHPRMDAEVIAMLGNFLEKIGFEKITFQINSIGCETCRPAFKDALLNFFSGGRGDLCPDCNRRYDRNPLRILDCKSSSCRDIRKGAPGIIDYLCGDCSSHFDSLRAFLGLLGVSFSVNQDMVRGLDYYTRTTFEVTSQSLGAQNAVAAGGRYDRLVKEFGGPETPAIGFAIGMERIVELLMKLSMPVQPGPAVFIAAIGEAAGNSVMQIADGLRRKGLWVETGDAGTSLKSQMRRADRMSASKVIIIGDKEIKSGVAKWKKLSDATQGEIRISEIADFILQKS